MAPLDTYSSNKTQVLETLFPNGMWRELLRDLVWELHDRLDPDEVVFRVDRRILGLRIAFDVRWSHIAMALVKLVGPRAA